MCVSVSVSVSVNVNVCVCVYLANASPHLLRSRRSPMPLTPFLPFTPRGTMYWEHVLHPAPKTTRDQDANFVKGKTKHPPP